MIPALALAAVMLVYSEPRGCESLGTVRAGWLNWEMTSLEAVNAELMRLTIKKGGNVVHVKVRERRESQPPGFRGKGIAYKCPAEETTEGSKGGDSIGIPASARDVRLELRLGPSGTEDRRRAR